MNERDVRGLRFPGVLTIVLIVLKITHVIDWSWLLVLSPVLFEIAITVLVCAVLYFMDR